MSAGNHYRIGSGGCYTISATASHEDGEQPPEKDKSCRDSYRSLEDDSSRSRIASHRSFEEVEERSQRRHRSRRRHERTRRSRVYRLSTSSSDSSDSSFERYLMPRKKYLIFVKKSVTVAREARPVKLRRSSSKSRKYREYKVDREVDREVNRETNSYSARDRKSSRDSRDYKDYETMHGHCTHCGHKSSQRDVYAHYDTMETVHKKEIPMKVRELRQVEAKFRIPELKNQLEKSLTLKPLAMPNSATTPKKDGEKSANSTTSANKDNKEKPKKTDSEPITPRTDSTTKSEISEPALSTRERILREKENRNKRPIRENKHKKSLFNKSAGGSTESAKDVDGNYQVRIHRSIVRTAHTSESEEVKSPADDYVDVAIPVKKNTPTVEKAKK